MLLIRVNGNCRERDRDRAIDLGDRFSLNFIDILGDREAPPYRRDPKLGLLVREGGGVFLGA